MFFRMGHGFLILPQNLMIFLEHVDIVAKLDDIPGTCGYCRKTG